MDSDASDSTTCAWEIDIPVKPERARQRKPKLSRATTPTLTTTKKDKGRPSPRCAVVVEPASPSRDVGPPVRTTREVFKRLVATLDSVLPTDFRSAPRPNGAGARSLGDAGRSVHDVLTDVVRAVAARRHKLDQQALLRERVSLMQAMLRSRGRITIEVETADCTIAAMSPGAEFFFKDAPWGSTLGQSLRDFVQWEDLENFNTLMMNPAGLPIEDQACSIRLIHFAVSDFPPLPQHIATSPFDESALERGGVGGSSSSAAGKGGTMSSSSHSGGGHTDSADSCLSAVDVAHAAGPKDSAGAHPAADYEDDALIPVRDSSADGWSDAFEHDPMLCDHADNNSSTHKPHLHGNYVETSFQVLRTSKTPQSALVAISLLSC